MSLVQFDTSTVPASPTNVNGNFNYLDENKVEMIELIAVTDTAPATCSTGDKYYNTTSSKIFTATGTNTWGTTGENPVSTRLYVDLANSKLYYYDGTNFSSYGGGAVNTTTTTSDTETYACNYVNNLSGKVLWTNPNPTNAGGFGLGTINLSSTDYDIYEVFYAQAVADVSSILLSQRSKKGCGTVLFSSLASGLSRRLSTATDSTITFADTSLAGTNMNNIPVFVVGYKTGVFN